MQERMNDKRLEMKEPEKCLQYLEDKAKVSKMWDTECLFYKRYYAGEATATVGGIVKV